MTKLQAGVVFNKFGKWFSVIEEVLQIENSLALIKGHDDDGYLKYWIFEYENYEWQPSYSSTSLEAMQDQFTMMVANRK